MVRQWHQECSVCLLQQAGVLQMDLPSLGDLHIVLSHPQIGSLCLGPLNLPPPTHHFYDCCVHPLVHCLCCQPSLSRPRYFKVILHINSWGKPIQVPCLNEVQLFEESFLPWCSSCFPPPSVEAAQHLVQYFDWENLVWRHLLSHMFVHTPHKSFEPVTIVVYKQTQLCVDVDGKLLAMLLRSTIYSCMGCHTTCSGGIWLGISGDST
jgi:hypothetical protein